MGEGVEVDCRRGRRAAGWVPDLGGDDLGVVEVGGAGGRGGELGGELAEAEVLALAVDQPEGGGVPEAGGAAVAEDHLVAVGQGEQLGQAVPQARPPPT